MTTGARRAPPATTEPLLTRVLGHVSEIVWPALPGPAGAAMLALQFQLDRTQWWPPEVLARQQRRQLAALLAHARRTVPFYEERLAGLELDGDVDPEAFATLPLLARTDIQAHGDALRSRAMPRDHGAPVEAASTGSTGRPIRVIGTQVHQFWWGAITLREHLWHGRNLGGKLAAIRTRVTTATQTGWGPATDCAFATGPCATLDIATDVAAQARWLEAEDPDYLLSHPSNLLALARYCASHGIRPTRLREVRSFGEALPPDLRAACREAWGVPLTDCYSATETGYLALQCPQREHYHVQAEHVLLEVLDETGRPCMPGETGRVVVTPLHNYAMPLVRYDLGDYAEVGDACACGRGLPVLVRILGRRRNMLRLPDGSSHWPSFPAAVWLAFPAIRQIQLVQTALDCITVRLACDRALTEAEQVQLSEELDRRLGWNFTYVFERHERLGTGPKHEDFVSMLDAPGA